MTDDWVNHPPHYTAHPSGIECIQAARLLPFTTGNAVKYIWRFDLKNGEQDLRKARWYLIDHLNNGLASHPPWKAKNVLLDVVAAETDPTRRVLLQHITHGRLVEAIECLDHHLTGGGGCSP